MQVDAIYKVVLLQVSIPFQTHTELPTSTNNPRRFHRRLKHSTSSTMACHRTLSKACLDILRAGLQDLGARGFTDVDFTTFPEAVPADPYWPHPPSVVFLQGLPIISLEDLPRDITTCIICHVPYDIRHPNEHPVALPWYVLLESLPRLLNPCFDFLNVSGAHRASISLFFLLTRSEIQVYTYQGNAD